MGADESAVAVHLRLKAHTGFEPVSGEGDVPEPLRRKLDELRAQSKRNAADRLIGKAHDYEHLAAALEDEWEAA